jgi:hypothetical protein
MNLEEFLKAIKEYPDEEVKIQIEGRDQMVHPLTAEFGIYDNWPILLRCDYKGIMNFLETHDNYSFEFETEKDPSVKFVRMVGPTRQQEPGKMKKVRGYNYIPGTGNLLVNDFVDPGVVSCKQIKATRDHHRRQMNDFTVSVAIHDYQEKKMERVPPERVWAMMIEDIGQFALKENIALCFPRSIGSKYLGDYSRILYHQP